MSRVLHVTWNDLDAGLNAIDQALAERPGEYEWFDKTVELELSTANQLWSQEGFPIHDAYLDVLAARYGAGMRLVDYIDAREEARQAINEWVSERTNERIPKLIAEGVLDEMTRLVLTNAVYLKAPWQHRFYEDEPGPFALLDGESTVAVQMMSVGEQLRYAAGGRPASGTSYEAVELPYVDGSLAMVVVVPGQGDFQRFEEEFDSAVVQEILAGLAPVHVNLEMPKFEFRTQASLAGALKELGMPVAFEDAADFSRMSPEGQDLFIQDVVHEAFIAVDEQGTEAAAATAVIAGATSAPAEIVDLVIDRPFLFLLHDRETGAILFMGRVTNPAE
jgi:serpin B